MPRFGPRQEVIWEILKSRSLRAICAYRVMVRNADAYVKRTDELHVDTVKRTRVKSTPYGISTPEQTSPPPPNRARHAVNVSLPDRGAGRLRMLSIAPDSIAEHTAIEGLQKLS